MRIAQIAPLTESVPPKLYGGTERVVSYITEALVEHVAGSKQKKIASITSGMGSMGSHASTGAYAYRSSKAALNMVMVTAANELRSRGISVAVISPGWVKTDMGGANATLTVAESASGIRKVIAGLTPSGSPDALRLQPPISNNSLGVIDPDLQFPQIHQWVASFQRDLWKNNVIEVNYIGKHAVHLLGGYDVNQVNVFARVPGISQNFLEAFNLIRADIAANGNNTITTHNSGSTGYIFTRPGTGNGNAIYLGAIGRTPYHDYGGSLVWSKSFTMERCTRALPPTCRLSSWLEKS